MRTRFANLSVGERFEFDPGVSSFRRICRKVSARCYVWDCANGEEMRTTVGTTTVTVRRIEEESNAAR